MARPPRSKKPVRGLPRMDKGVYVPVIKKNFDVIVKAWVRTRQLVLNAAGVDMITDVHDIDNYFDAAWYEVCLKENRRRAAKRKPWKAVQK